jgi:putative PIN family toxin of toxin-antitoxin system
LKIVLDTNVIVSGLLTPRGAAAEIVRMAAAVSVELCFDARILDEYRTVLGRPRFGFDPSAVAVLLAHIETEGHLAAPPPLPKPLPDPADEPFLAVALASNARALVTRNIRHYPAASRQGMMIVSPGDFMMLWRKERGRAGGPETVIPFT